MFRDGDFDCLDKLLKPVREVLRSGRNIAKDTFEERSKLWNEIQLNYRKYRDGVCGEFSKDVDKQVRSEFEYALLTLAWSFFENGERFEETKRFKGVELAVFDKIERYDVFDVLDVNDLKRRLSRNDEKTIKKLEEYFVYMRDTLDEILDDPEIDNSFIKYYANKRWKSFRKKIDDAISQLIHEIDWLGNLISVWNKRAKEIDPEKLKTEWIKEVEEKLKGIFASNTTSEHTATLQQDQPYTVLSKKYEFLELLGQGGFAQVYKCRRRENGKLVAVKIPSEEGGKSFVDEVVNWRKLKHEYIVELYDYDVLPYPHLEMELCDGILCFDNLYFKDKIKILYKIALALNYAHEVGVVHGDLKPSNVLVKGNTPKLTDWGLGYTIAYAPPEIISGEMDKFDEVADIWSFGVLAYEIITGTNPFLGEDEIETMSKIMDSEPEFSKLGSLEPIVKKCLRKEREHRYKSMREVIDDLKSLNVSVLSQHLSKSKNRRDIVSNSLEIVNVYVHSGDYDKALNRLDFMTKYKIMNVKFAEIFRSIIEIASMDPIDLDLLKTKYKHILELVPEKFRNLLESDENVGKLLKKIELSLPGDTIKSDNEFYTLVKNKFIYRIIDLIYEIILNI